MLPAMTNRDHAAMWAYHEGTKHSIASLRRSPHGLDWEIMPLPFKVYPTLEPIQLPRDFASSERPAIHAIADAGTIAGAGPGLDLARLAHLFYFTAGVLRRRRSHPGGDVYFRAQACTGNLHHIDLYLICGALPELAAGVYHFSPHDFALRQLRAGDYRAAVVAATGGETAVARVPAVIACTSTFWRNAWKYQARTYRHCFWDNGTLLANLLAVTAAMDLPAHVVLGFADDQLNQLLALDSAREVTLSLVAVGAETSPPAPAPAIVPLALETLPLSSREVDYPAIRAAHAASSLGSGAEAAAWRGPLLPQHGVSPTAGEIIPLAPDVSHDETIESVILRRGSTRQFTHEPIGFDVLSTILRYVSRDLSADVLARDASETDLYLIVNAVDTLAPGAYVFDGARDALALLRGGEFRREAGHLDLGQDLAADAAVNLYWLVDLHPPLERFGNRGYRAAQLEAAIRGGKTYLAAFALGIGATGLTFFDDDVTEFFSPHAAGKSVMFLMAIGQPAQRLRR